MTIWRNLKRGSAHAVPRIVCHGQLRNEARLQGDRRDAQSAHAAVWRRVFAAFMSRAGGSPNILPYSRVNCGTLSYREMDVRFQSKEMSGSTTDMGAQS